MNLEAEEIWVRWQLQRREGPAAPAYDQDIDLGGPLPLPDICLDALRSHQDMVEKWRIEVGEAWHDSGLIPSTTSTAGSRTARRRPGVPVVSVHSTRRTCASLLVELDVHPRVGMQNLRHS